jgi:hypothetical protein
MAATSSTSLNSAADEDVSHSLSSDSPAAQPAPTEETRIVSADFDGERFTADVGAADGRKGAGTAPLRPLRLLHFPPPPDRLPPALAERASAAGALEPATPPLDLRIHIAPAGAVRTLRSQSVAAVAAVVAAPDVQRVLRLMPGEVLTVHCLTESLGHGVGEDNDGGHEPEGLELKFTGVQARGLEMDGRGRELY